MTKRCVLCGETLDACICCPEDGHVCPRDSGELDCPICGPLLKVVGRIP